jgi:hypothetical protein
MILLSYFNADYKPKEEGEKVFQKSAWRINTINRIFIIATVKRSTL